MNLEKRPLPPKKESARYPDSELNNRNGEGRVDCGVVVVTYNSAGHIEAALASLKAAAAGMTLRVVVVDNGSDDGTLALVRENPNVICVETAANLGYAGGINVGRQVAGDYDALLVLNPDVVLAAGALREMFAALRYPGVGIVAPMLLDADGRCFPSLRREPTPMRAIGDGLLGRRLSWRPGCLSEIVWNHADYLRPHAVDWATGAAWLISSSCDRVVGRWDERFFLYSEEIDYAARARDAGFLIYYQPTARVRHSEGGSGRSDVLVALHAVNRIRYMEKRGQWPRFFRAVVILHEALRYRKPSHRVALHAVMRRSSWQYIKMSLQSGGRLEK
jgi:GT2 family glycosyltransferase